VWELCPVNTWELSALRSAVLPSVFKLDPAKNEGNEKRRLEAKDGFNWKDPQLLFGYSKDSEYKDLGIYFDHGDKHSPVNQVATKVFKMYGFKGQEIDWHHIRGSVIIFRMEPGVVTNLVCEGAWHTIPLRFQPLISEEELIETLLFFQNNTALDVALHRDFCRKEKYRPQPPRNKEANAGNEGNAEAKGLVADLAGSSDKDSRKECNNLNSNSIMAQNTSLYPASKIKKMDLSLKADA
jgi:hypothetical protein